jgi:type I restriction enzyme M protein
MPGCNTCSAPWRPGLAAWLWCCRTGHCSARKAPERTHKILILDAAREFKSGRAQNELLPEHVERIHGWYHAYQDVAGVARVVTLEEIAANDYNLNIPRYVEPQVDQEVLSVDEALQRLQASAAEAFAAEDRLIALLKREGLLQ